MSRFPLVAVAVVALTIGCSEAPSLQSLTAGQATACEKGRFDPRDKPALDYREFVRLDGTLYAARGYRNARRVAESDVGREVGTVRCHLDSSRVDPYGDQRDGDASFVEVGTPVHAVRGQPARCHVVAEELGELVVFTATDGQGWRSGCDRWPLRAPSD